MRTIADFLRTYSPTAKGDESVTPIDLLKMLVANPEWAVWVHYKTNQWSFMPVCDIRDYDDVTIAFKSENGKLWASDYIKSLMA